MKTLFNILATLAVIASASADSNAICNGEIGNHASQVGGRDYISCVPSDNGEILAQVQVCPKDQKFCPRTNGCLLSQECEIENQHDSSSEESDSSDSSSSSSSDEVLKCSEKVWYELCPTLPGCLFCCEHEAGHSRSEGDKCSHDLANCEFGVCKDFENQAADCRVSAGDTCPGECCGQGCALTPPCGTLVADNTTCKNACCSGLPIKSGLFGSSFRGQISTEICTSCPDDSFFCPTTGQCEQIENLSDDACRIDIYSNCNCNFTNLMRDPENCNNALVFCNDIDQYVKLPCPPGALFSKEINDCVYPDYGEVYERALDECICGQPGYVATANGCSGTLCCLRDALSPPDVGGQPRPPVCYGGKPCLDTEFFCETQKTCLAFGDGTCLLDNNYQKRCCTDSVGPTCNTYTIDCPGEAPADYLCEPSFSFYCSNRPGFGGEKCGLVGDGTGFDCDTLADCDPIDSTTTTTTPVYDY